VSGLTVSALRLTQFRSHRRLELSFDARPVAIFGPNGAGKTNILEALSFLSPGRGLRRAAKEDIARRPDAVGWKLAATLDSLGTLHEIETASQGGAARTVQIDGKTAPQLALARLARVVWLVPVMDRLWVEAAEGRRRFLDRLTMGFLPDHGDASLAYEKAMRERNRLLKDGVADAGWYGALEGQMAEAAAQIDANRRAALARLDRALTEGGDRFPQAALSLAGPDGPEEAPFDADGLARLWADTRHRDLAAGRTLVGPHRSDLDAVYTAKALPARDCSTGEQKALLLSLVLANARALREDFGAPPLLLLDEVAAHLDADRRAALYDEITALGAQAWMTGTGPDLFEALGPRAQRLTVTDDAGTSVVTPA
jgi:DNA replication and repair protein RecF